MCSTRAASPEVQLHLLDGFKLVLSGRTLPTPPRTVQRLLAFLALHDHTLERVYVAGLLWCENDGARANANLRSAVWRTNRCDQRLIDAGPHQVALQSDVWVDVAEVSEIARGVTAGGGPFNVAAVHQLTVAGELLPDWYDDWVEAYRERLRQLHLHALDELCQRLTIDGRYTEAIEAGLAAVRSRPLRESSHCALIKAHLAEGNASEALLQFQTLRRLLRSELRLEPSPAASALVAHLMDSASVPASGSTS